MPVASKPRSRVRGEMLGVRLFPAEVAAIRARAVAEERSVSSVLRRALRASGYLDGVEQSPENRVG